MNTDNVLTRSFALGLLVVGIALFLFLGATNLFGVALSFPAEESWEGAVGLGAAVVIGVIVLAAGTFQGINPWMYLAGILTEALVWLMIAMAQVPYFGYICFYLGSMVIAVLFILATHPREQED